MVHIITNNLGKNIIKVAFELYSSCKRLEFDIRYIMILAALFSHTFRNGQGYSILFFQIYLDFQLGILMPIGLTCTDNSRIFETFSSSDAPMKLTPIPSLTH